MTTEHENKSKPVYKDHNLLRFSEFLLKVLSSSFFTLKRCTNGHFNEINFMRSFISKVDPLRGVGSVSNHMNSRTYFIGSEKIRNCYHYVGTFRWIFGVGLVKREITLSDLTSF